MSNEKRNEYIRNYRANKKANGICRDCPTPVDGTTRCEKCSNLSNGVVNKLRKSRISNGLCDQCGEQTLEHSATLCEVCWFKQKSATALGTTKHWEYLRDLFYQQNAKCQYTGVDLVLGDNTSADHVHCKEKCPELATEPTNIVWCDTGVNKIKNSKTYLNWLMELSTGKQLCNSSEVA